MLKPSAIVGSAFLFLSMVMLTDACPAQGGVAWQQQNPVTSPPARVLHALAFDTQRQEVVLFGGATGAGLMNDTWVFNGTTWAQQFPAASPSARSHHAMAYDSVRRRTVLFGGNSTLGALNDTWEWNGSNWIPRSPSIGPSVRISHGMVYDPARGQVVLFGGATSATPGGRLLDDTWQWNGVTWTLFTPSQRPAARLAHAMAYDAALQVVVLFGGQLPTSFASDTWEWNGANWTPRFPTPRPGSRSAPVMVYDGSRQRTVLFGGQGGNPVVPLSETWEWDGASWTQHLPIASPPARLLHAMVYDDAGRVVMFGGWNGTANLSDTWSLSSQSPATFSLSGAGCPGSQGNLTLNPIPFSLPWTGDNFAVDLGNLPSGSFPFMALGFSSTTWSGGTLPRDLTAVGLPGCWQLVSAEAAVSLTLNVNSATWSQTVPVNPALVGWSLFLQGAALNAGGNNMLGAALSNGGQATIGMR